MNAPILKLAEDDPFYVSIGEVVAGKYLVERVLGAGGMAFVLSARHLELDQCFALKFLDKRFLGNARITERFTQEARAASQIRSEHVARVYDVGLHEGAPFFVMEHLEGRDLCAVLLSGGPLRVEDAVEYVMQACEALAVAHCHGVVHRDIKPENLFLVERHGLPSVKLLDFGISKVALTGAEAPSRLTGELTLGTPCYMSPEQIRSTATVDARSDQWSLGVVLYELLAGIEAFRADSVSAMCAAVLETEPSPLGDLCPDVPPGLAAVIERCLVKDPAGRFTDVAELAQALLPFAPSRALVSVERSSSIMRAAGRAGDREMHTSMVRASTPREPRSTGPLARPVSDAAGAAPAARRGAGALVVVALVVAVATLAGTLAVERRNHVASLAPPPTAVAPPAPEPPSLVVATVKAEPEPALRTPETTNATLPIARRAAPPPVAVAHPAGLPHASASAVASSQETRGAKRLSEPPSSDAKATPSVELGY